MRSGSRLALGLGLGLIAVTSLPAIASCAMSKSDCTFDGTCAGPGPGTDAGGDGANPSDAPVVIATVPPGCDVAADAKDSLPCEVDSFALFVNANANDGGDGTKERPFRAIDTAIAAVASSGKRRIYVCGTDTYASHLELNAQSYARLIGGFDCASWAPAAGLKPKVMPSDPGYALHIDQVPSEVRVEDMAFEVPPGIATARSSIAVFVASSPNVTFKRVDIKAGAGAPGPDGIAGVTGTADQSTLDGSSASSVDASGGPAKICKCSSGGSSTGGKGGDVGGTDHDGMAGFPVIAPTSLPNAGTGQTQAACNMGGSAAGKGSDAPAAKDGVLGQGSLDVAGWKEGDGAAGAAGIPGQGGGGGGSANQSGANNGGGGGGACGGCGGAGGTGGGGGGSSIALLTHQSPVQLSASTAMSGDAAVGGSGRVGGPGGNGGAKGAGFKDGCSGGAGGFGGHGGAGAGGAGGISAAVLYSGASPVNDGSTLTNGMKGVGGAGGAATNAGPDGVAGGLVPAP